MRVVTALVIALALTARSAEAQSVTLQLVPTTTTCSPSNNFLYCTDTGIVNAGPLAIGTYARTIYPPSNEFLNMFYGAGKPGCGPVEEKLSISVLPPITALGAYLHLEAITFGRPGSTELCTALGMVGAGSAPSGLVALTSADLAAFRGLSWSHPSLSSPNLVNLRLP